MDNTQPRVEPVRRDPEAFEDYEVWSVESKPVSIHLRSAVAGQVRAMSNTPLVSGLPIESGGILWGRVRHIDDDYCIVSVEQAERLECDRSLGMGWGLSAKDRRELSKLLKQKHEDLRPVGFWRSHRRLGLYLDKHDLEFMKEFFPNPWSIALCVRPPATAGFFIWERGDIRRTSSYREFQLPDTGQLAVVPVPPKAVRPWKPWGVETWNWEWDKWKSPEKKKWIAIACLVLVAAVLPFLPAPGRAPAAFNVLSMKAQTKPGSVVLSWDTRNKLLQRGDNVVLWIADGADESKLELSGSQARSGSIEYTPSTANVNFRMQVGDFTESLNVNAVPRTGTQAVADSSLGGVPVETPGFPDAAVEEHRARRSRPSASPRTLAPPIADTRNNNVASRSIEVPPPPEIALGPARLERPNLPSRAAEIPKIAVSVENPGSSPIKKVFGWMFPGRKKGYVPPKAISQVRPHITAPKPTSVSVRVEIDDQGRVRDADLLTKKVDTVLGLAAVEAAKRWRFEPARQEDRAIASSMVVKFQFGEENP